MQATAEAIPLVMVEDGQFQVNEDAAALLQQFQAKICVVSIAGVYRSGKSYLLNRIVRASGGFAVGSTVDACTHGIWLWGDPLKHELSSGEECLVVFLDTEGLGSVQESPEHDIRIFGLTVLLSSHLLFNCKATIDESTIENLSFVSQLARHIHISTPSGGDEGGDEEADEAEAFDRLARFFPAFHWVIRDFTLQLEDEYANPISPDQYMETALQERDDVGADEERNRTRRAIRSLFTHRRCTTLSPPHMDSEVIQKLGDVHDSELSTGFVDGIQQLRDTLMAEVTPKSLHGRALNGPMFVDLVRSYANAMNGDAVPAISDAWEDAVREETKRAKEEAGAAVAAACDAIKGDVPIPEEDLRRRWSEAVSRAVARCRARLPGRSRESDVAEVEEEAASRLNRLLKDNFAASERACEDALAEAAEGEMGPRLRGEGQYWSVEAVRKDWERAADAYRSRASGPASDAVLARLGPARVLEGAETAEATQRSAAAEAAREAEEAASHLRSELGAEKSRCEGLAKRVDTAERAREVLEEDISQWRAATEQKMRTIEMQRKQLVQAENARREAEEEGERRVREAKAAGEKALQEAQAAHERAVDEMEHKAAQSLEEAERKGEAARKAAVREGEEALARERARWDQDKEQAEREHADALRKAREEAEQEREALEQDHRARLRREREEADARIAREREAQEAAVARAEEESGRERARRVKAEEERDAEKEKAAEERKGRKRAEAEAEEALGERDEKAARLETSEEEGRAATERATKAEAEAKVAADKAREEQAAKLSEKDRKVAALQLERDELAARSQGCCVLQ